MKKILFFIIIGLTACTQNHKSVEPKTNQDSVPKLDSVEAMRQAEHLVDSTEKHWSYRQDTDQMRNAINKFASIHSIDGKFLLMIRNKEGKKDILICSNDDIFDNINISCKFDNDEIEYCDGDKSEDATAIFLEDFNISKRKGDLADKFDTNKSGFIEKLRKHKKLIIEVNLYSKTVQSVFDITGLRWE